MNRRGFLKTTLAAAVAAAVCPISALAKAACPPPDVSKITAFMKEHWDPVLCRQAHADSKIIDRLLDQMRKYADPPSKDDAVFALTRRMEAKLQKLGIPTRRLL